MNVLLSIKPEYALRIFEGTKKFEFRKTIFKRQGVSKIIVYASSPMQQVIGEFEIKSILSEIPDTLWGMTKNESGITKEFFDKYFADKEKGFAIQVGAVKRYSSPKQLSDYKLDYAPQSFVYIEN